MKMGKPTWTGLATLLLFIYVVMASKCLWKESALRLAFPTMSLMSPMRSANTKTPINQEAVMNKISALFPGAGFLFLPIDVAVWNLKKI